MLPGQPTPEQAADRARAAATVAKHKDDDVLIEYALRNMRPLKGSAPGSPMWSHVAYLFGVGSTVAAALCHRFGFDPDGKLIAGKGWPSNEV